jgi:hypothetical protein
MGESPQSFVFCSAAAIAETLQKSIIVRLRGIAEIKAGRGDRNATIALCECHISCR